ncbi:MAG: Ribosomal RNA small subunit methyltransferase E [Chroococcopsis gigantea SAG 12.99]|jgi:16S rRNA (uracil1498-N3)-methyltransferase|nr:16S rRNA (uracil(1498)-N(3))-methyltransferase [Chlorogloea purpurea SAG 13.99]MDV3001886.1 Ribosomal RNA small subunit methyltransferase E [Chroococcopsis gigantea SAG 12.99]
MYRLVLDFDQAIEQKIPLTSEQCHYLQRVLRLKDGDRFIALDGRGQCWETRISDRYAHLLTPLEEFRELPVYINLQIALPKGNGFDDLVRACTELGVSRITPLITQRTLNHPGSNKVERWRKIATEAVEQSERQIIPIIEQPVLFSSVLTNLKDLETDRYICVTRRSGEHLLHKLHKGIGKTVIVAIGPEGGWTENELEMAFSCHYQPVSLGKTILRTITAPVVVMSIISAYLN